MESARWHQLQAIFLDALPLTEAKRTAFVEEACAADTEMLAEVCAMLKADRRADSMMDRGLLPVADWLIGPGNGEVQQEIGAYRLLRLIGEGGMGVVYLAERKDLGNQVAIKFLLHAGLSPVRRELFAREVKLLAKLQHKGIARLYDAGTLDNGTPWFVMEYVEGKRLTEYCQHAAWTAREVIDLFRQICEAVQYAHGQEIIHRDLKPSNVMIDGQGTPRLLDFGVAKQLSVLADGAENTRSGLRLLTPEYAAPEWADHGIVGPYTDVYSLGVIFYQMLTGQLPAKSPEAAVAKPSSAASRVPGLSKAEWHDLDRLCLTAKAADVKLRYQSVEALLRDIDHFRKNEPLEAQPPSFPYRLGKFVRRNRSAVTVASLLLALFAGMAIFFTWRLAQERNAALAEAARTKRIERFTLNLFGAGDKAAAPSKDLRVLTLLDLGARQAGELRADPETQADIYQTLGEIYRLLGDPTKASDLESLGLEKMKAAVGPDSPKVAEALIQMGTLRSYQGRFKEAENLIQQGLNLAHGRVPADDPILLKGKASLGGVWTDSRQNEKAIAILSPLVRLPPSGEEGPYILRESLSSLAVAEQYMGHYQRAEELLKRTLDWDRRLYGESHPRFAFDMADLGSVEVSLGRYPEAERLYRDSLRINGAWYGESNPDVLATKSILAAIIIQEGRFSEADSLLKKVLALQEQALGNQHPYVCYTLDTLGKLALRRGDLAAAQDYFERAFALSRSLFGPADFSTAIVESDFADVFMRRGDYVRAESLLREAVVNLARHPSPGNPSIGAVQANFGAALVRLKRYREAEAPLEAGYAILKSKPAVYSKRIEDARRNLTIVYSALGERDKATRLRAGS